MMADVPHRKPMPSSYQSTQSPQVYTHSRTRTSSSNTFPLNQYPPHQQQLYPPKMQVHAYTSRRTPSNATFSTIASSGNGPVPFRQASQDLQRSASNRSGGASQPSSYVALMRRQKATVWCDRAQTEDTRLQKARQVAKMRANVEVMGGNLRTSTGSSASLASGNRVTAKIRHHGKAALVGYSPGDLVGGVGGVPMRLSASEVEGGDSDDDADSGNMAYHRRSGSGRSSLGSQRRGLTYSRQSGASSTVGRWSAGHSPPNEAQDETQETPVPFGHQRAKDYFASTTVAGDGARSMGSGSSGERADAVNDEIDRADAARLASNSLLKSTTMGVKREASVGGKNPDELRRRGSVDERTMTMSAGRLYIANPDQDSD